ncbi:MAG: exopolysaccharide biosynthesis protein [Firmicutes bacterium HGW-Firmicutes-9]|jgi:exopolysaccharide biosynthesis protein|nr:MAG: exopolysaccharide biosynthesis protein [Firmicutes bacterium HGW-Firmicutes-9]
MVYKHKHVNRKTKKKFNAIKVILRDIIFFGIALNIFALFHHVLPRKLQPVDASRYSSFTPTPIISDTLTSSLNPSSVTPPPSASPIPGDFSMVFPATDTGVNALYSYQTDTVKIAINRVQENSVTYFVADVYVKNIDALKTAFAKGKYGKNIYDFPLTTANENQAVFAVTGDYYSARSQGIVVRNGTLYRDVPNTDVCILYNDGELKTYDSANFNLTEAVSRGIWQSWSFGPPLLDENGGKLSEFNSTLTDRHPRSAIGYYTPGHYCFVIVDGRQKDYSIGMNLTELSALFESLGCKQAYNFDGGATAVMIFQGNVINQPYKGGRESGDIIYFD